MDAQRDGAAHGRAEMLGVEALVVDAVAGLVQDAEEALVEETRIVACGESAIARADAAAEGMGRDVEPAGAKVEADSRGCRLAKELLPLDGKVTLQNIAAWLLLRRGDGGNKRHQVLAQSGKDVGNLGRCGARFVFVK